MKRSVALLLTLLMLLPLFAACKKDGETVTLFKKGVCKITYDTSTVQKKDVDSLLKAIENTTGITPELVKSDDPDCQIFVGMVDSLAVQGAMGSLRVNDYTVGVYDGALVIAGFSDVTTGAAIRYFIRDVLPLTNEKGVLKLSSEGNYRYLAKYNTAPISVGGLPLGKHSIVIPQNYTQSELYFAYELYEKLLAGCGYALSIVTADDVTTEGQIRIGPSICERASVPATHGYTIAGNGKHLEIAASTALGYEGVRNVLFSRVIPLYGKDENRITDESVWSEDYAGKAGTTMLPDGDLRVMSHNVYGGHQAQHVMGPRTDLLTELYLIYKPAVLAIQEYFPSVDNTGFTQKLQNGGYRLVEMPHAAKTNRGCDATPLFYDPAVVTLLDSGYIRFNNLSYNEYPELLGNQSASALKAAVQDPSDGADFAIFRVNRTGKVFLAASTHWWWKTADDAKNVTARRIQAQVFKDTLAGAAAEFAAEAGLSAATIPILAGGDYNCRIRSTPLNQMSAETTLKLTLGGVEQTVNTAFANANDLATNKLTHTTYHGIGDYKTALDVPGYLKKNPSVGLYSDPSISDNPYSYAIDHFFTNVAAQGMLRINRVGILTDHNAYLGSDHSPVYVDVVFDASCPVYTGPSFVG